MFDLKKYVCLFFFFFRKASSCNTAGPETHYTSALNSQQSSCLGLLSAEITGASLQCLLSEPRNKSERENKEELDSASSTQRLRSRELLCSWVVTPGNRMYSSCL